VDGELHETALGGCVMTIHAKFIGRLIRKPESAGPKKYGFTNLALTTSDGAGGVNEVHVLLDPKVLDRPETSKEALQWNTGDLVQLEGVVVKIGICKCCGNPLPVIDALKCYRVQEMV
jgi:hypothetical protein